MPSRDCGDISSPRATCSNQKALIFFGKRKQKNFSFSRTDLIYSATRSVLIRIHSARHSISLFDATTTLMSCTDLYTPFISKHSRRLSLFFSSFLPRLAQYPNESKLSPMFSERYSSFLRLHLRRDRRCRTILISIRFSFRIAMGKMTSSAASSWRSPPQRHHQSAFVVATIGWLIAALLTPCDRRGQQAAVVAAQSTEVYFNGLLADRQTTSFTSAAMPSVNLTLSPFDIRMDALIAAVESRRSSLILMQRHPASWAWYISHSFSDAAQSVMLDFLRSVGPSVSYRNNIIVSTTDAAETSGIVLVTRALAEVLRSTSTAVESDIPIAEVESITSPLAVLLWNGGSIVEGSSSSASEESQLRLLADGIPAALTPRRGVALTIAGTSDPSCALADVRGCLEQTLVLLSAAARPTCATETLPSLGRCVAQHRATCASVMAWELLQFHSQMCDATTGGGVPEAAVSLCRDGEVGADALCGYIVALAEGRASGALFPTSSAIVLLVAIILFVAS